MKQLLAVVFLFGVAALIVHAKNHKSNGATTPAYQSGWDPSDAIAQ